MDDSNLPKHYTSVNKRLTQSLSPLSLNNFMTQKKKIQKKQSSQLNLDDDYQNSKGSMQNIFLDLNEATLCTIFSDHLDLFNLVQELLLFHKPIPFLILISLMNLSFYFYRSFNLSFYPQIVVIIFGYFLSKLLYPYVWPIIYETLFANENKIVNETEQNNKTEEEENNELGTEIISNDPQIDPNTPSHLKSPEEAANILFKYINHLRIFCKAYLMLTRDDSSDGLKISLCIYSFFFCLFALFDLFWPTVIICNFIILFPGIYYNQLIRNIIVGFRKKWRI